MSVSDAKADPRLRDNLAVRDLGVVAYLGVPLCMPDGSVLGSLCAIDKEDREWEPEDISALWGPCSDRDGRDCIAARDGQAREAGANEKREREFNDESKQSLVAVQSILDSHAALV